MDQNQLLSILETNLARNISWIGAADTKAAFVFTIDLAMFGFLAAAAPAYGKWTSAGVVCALIAALLLLASLLSLTLTVWPRVAGPQLSLIFFGSVARRTVDDYREELMALDPAAHVEDLIQQTHINALIAGQKFTWIKRATACLYVAIPPWVAASYLLFRDK